MNRSRKERRFGQLTVAMALMAALSLTASSASAQQSAKKTPQEVADSAACEMAPAREVKGLNSLRPPRGQQSGEMTLSLGEPTATAATSADSAAVRAAQAEFDSLAKAGAKPVLPKARFVTCNGAVRLVKSDGKQNTEVKEVK